MFKCQEAGCGCADFRKTTLKGMEVWECTRCHMCYDARAFVEKKKPKKKDSYYKSEFEEYQHYKFVKNHLKW